MSRTADLKGLLAKATRRHAPTPFADAPKLWAGDDANPGHASLKNRVRGVQRLLNKARVVCDARRYGWRHTLRAVFLSLSPSRAPS